VELLHARKVICIGPDEVRAPLRLWRRLNVLDCQALKRIAIQLNDGDAGIPESWVNTNRTDPHETPSASAAQIISASSIA